MEVRRAQPLLLPLLLLPRAAPSRAFLPSSETTAASACPALSFLSVPTVTTPLLMLWPLRSPSPLSPPPPFLLLLSSPAVAALDDLSRQDDLPKRGLTRLPPAPTSPSDGAAGAAESREPAAPAIPGSLPTLLLPLPLPLPLPLAAARFDGEWFRCCCCCVFAAQLLLGRRFEAREEEVALTVAVVAVAVAVVVAVVVVVVVSMAGEVERETAGLVDGGRPRPRPRGSLLTAPVFVKVMGPECLLS